MSSITKCIETESRLVVAWDWEWEQKLITSGYEETLGSEKNKMFKNALWLKLHTYINLLKITELYI